ncbi:unnamed protein product, partial [Ectocarpus sp. 12 AP-2014]
MVARICVGNRLPRKASMTPASCTLPCCPASSRGIPTSTKPGTPMPKNGGLLRT